MPKRGLSRATKADHATADRIALRTALGQRASDAWFDTDEACIYLGFKRGGLRKSLDRGLAADGRGAKGALMFRKATLDAFLEARR